MSDMEEQKQPHKNTDNIPKDDEKHLMSAEGTSVSSCFSQGDAVSQQNIGHICHSTNRCTPASIIKISLRIRMPNQRKDTREETSEAVSSKIPEKDTKDNAAHISQAESPPIACRSIAVNLKTDSSDDDEDDDERKLNKANGAVKEVILPVMDKFQESLLTGRNQLVCRAYLPCPFQLPDEIQSRNKDLHTAELWKRLIELDKQVEKLPALKNEIISLRRENTLLKIELMSLKATNVSPVATGESSSFDIPGETVPNGDSESINNPTEQDVQKTENLPDESLETSMACCQLSSDDAENSVIIRDAPETESLSVVVKTDGDVSTADDNELHVGKQTHTETKHLTSEGKLICTESFSSDQFQFASWIRNEPLSRNLVIKTEFRCPSVPDLTRQLLNPSNDVKPNTAPQTVHSISTQTSQFPSLLSDDVCKGHDLPVQSVQVSHSQVQCSEFVDDPTGDRLLRSQPLPNNEDLLTDKRKEPKRLKDLRSSSFRQSKPRKEAVVRPIPRTPLYEETHVANNRGTNARPIFSSSGVSSCNESEHHELDEARTGPSPSQWSSAEDILQIPTRSILFYCSDYELSELERLLQRQRNHLFIKLCHKCYHSLKSVTESNCDLSEVHAFQRVSAARGCQTVPEDEEESHSYPQNASLSEEPDTPVKSPNNSRCHVQTNATRVDKNVQCTKTTSITKESALNSSQPKRKLSLTEISYIGMRSSSSIRSSNQRPIRLLTLRQTLIPRDNQPVEEEEDENQQVTVNNSNDLFKNSSEESASYPNSESNGSQIFESTFTDAADESQEPDINENNAEKDLKRNSDLDHSEKENDNGISEDFIDACKVINGYLLDLDKERDNSLRNPVLLVQQKWLEVAGSKTSSVDSVLKYIQFFGSLSKEMLKWVVNCVDPDGNTVLNFALANSNFDVVKLLLETGFCDVDKPNKVGHTAIIICASSRPETDDALLTVQTMLKMGNINFKSLQHGQTALMTAVSYGSVPMVSLLLEAGADVNAQDDDGSTALMFAAERGDAACTKLLLNHPKCDALMKDNNGINACTIALNAGHSYVGLLIYARTTGAKVPSKLKRKKKICKI